MAPAAAACGVLAVNPMVITVVSLTTPTLTCFTSSSGDCAARSPAATFATSADFTISDSVAMSGCRVLAVLPGTGVTATSISGVTTIFACA